MEIRGVALKKVSKKLAINEVDTPITRYLQFQNKFLKNNLGKTFLFAFAIFFAIAMGFNAVFRSSIGNNVSLYKQKCPFLPVQTKHKSPLSEAIPVVPFIVEGLDGKSEKKEKKKKNKTSSFVGNGKTKKPNKQITMMSCNSKRSSRIVPVSDYQANLFSKIRENRENGHVSSLCYACVQILTISKFGVSTIHSGRVKTISQKGQKLIPVIAIEKDNNGSYKPRRRKRSGWKNKD